MNQSRSGLRMRGLPWRWAVLACLMLASAFTVSGTAQAARLALVVGLDDYDAIGDLRNAAADAQAMGQALRDLGYDHVQIVQPRRTQRELRDDIRAFAARIRNGDEVLFFFSGHGVQLGGTNFLLSSDVRSQSEAQVRDDALLLSNVLQDLREPQHGARPAFTLAIIDACRDNPFQSLGKSIGARGLTGVAGTNGQMVIYAAGEGQQALDRLPSDAPTVRNGLFTRVFLERMRQPGVPVPNVLREVRAEVVRLARNAGFTQVPAMYDQAVGAFYSVPPTARPAPASDVELESWTLCRPGFTRLPCDDYLRQWPSGRFTVLARTRIADLQRSQPSGEREPSPTPSLTPAPPVSSGQLDKDCADCPEMVVIPAGRFLRGSPQSEVGSDEDERPQRTVTVGSFLLARTEVTQRQWVAVMGSNPSRFKGCDNCPVENVSYNDAKEYIRRLNQQTGRSYRLPTEAEWEYAARAGTTTEFSTGRTITTDQANFDGWGRYNGSPRGQYRQRTTPVGSFPVNRWGLADMHGNVREWVEDCYVESYRGASSDARPVTTGDCSQRVLRGGGWNYLPRWLRSAYRDWIAPENRDDITGFRLARTLP